MPYPKRVVLVFAIEARDVVVDPEDEIHEAVVPQRGLVSVLKRKLPFSKIRTRQTCDKIKVARVQNNF